MRVASRFGEAAEDRCPKCSFVQQNFIVLSDSEWGCFNCGTVFVPKSIRLREKGKQKSQLVAQDALLKKQVKSLCERGMAVDNIQKETNVPKDRLIRIIKEMGFERICVECGKPCRNKKELAEHTKTHEEAEETK